MRMANQISHRSRHLPTPLRQDPFRRWQEPPMAHSVAWKQGSARLPRLNAFQVPDQVKDSKIFVVCAQVADFGEYRAPGRHRSRVISRRGNSEFQLRNHLRLWKPSAIVPRQLGQIGRWFSQAWRGRAAAAVPSVTRCAIAGEHLLSVDWGHISIRNHSPL
jgi:hypothetical protein